LVELYKTLTFEYPSLAKIALFFGVLMLQSRPKFSEIPEPVTIPASVAFYDILVRTSPTI
jgi:hypothetical protein